MEKEKKNNNTGVIIVLAILLIAVIAFGIWAWSKYTTTVNGNGTATVAQWNFGVSNETELQNMDLAVASTNNIFDDVNNVKTGRIAPGTSGHFSVLLNTTGTEVALKYDVVLSKITNKPDNLHFYSDAACTKLIDTSDGAKISGTIAQGDTGTAKTVTIYWKWAYETGSTANEIADNDAKDTADGEAAERGVTFDLTITGTQVDPGTSQVTTVQND